MKVEIQSTGEVLDFEPKTFPELMQLWLMCKEYIEAYTKVKDSLKPMIEDSVNDKGVSEASDGFVFKVIPIQRKNYDKSVLRSVFDEDELDLFLEPNKSAIDKYIKDNLEELGTSSTTLRESMVPVGRPYQTIKAERIERK